MKTLLIAALALVSSAAFADVVFVQPAAINNCTTPVQKMELARYLNGKSDAQKPACYTLGSIAATTPAVNNCKTAMEKQALRNFLNGKSDAAMPACYSPNKWVGHAKSSAGCSFAEKLQIRQAERNSSVALPACYK